MKSIQRILVLQLKRIGDFILTVPALNRLRDLFPEAEIVLAVPSSVKELASSVTSVDRVVAFYPKALNVELWFTTSAGAWDLCLDFTGTDRSQLLTWLSRAKHRLGYEKFATGKLANLAYHQKSKASVRDLHTVDFHLALVELTEPLSEKTEKENESSHGFKLSSQDSSSAHRKRFDAGSRGNYAIVHLGTAREEKFWPIERWAEIIHLLKTEWDLDVVLTGSGDGLEVPHLEKLRELLELPVCDLTGELSLTELLALIEDCEVILGVDSMAMHLASSVQAKQIALFGPTNPYHWRPRHPDAYILIPGSELPVAEFQPKAKGAEMELLSTTSVVSAIRQILSH